jgi:hypothetical protein
MNFKFSFFFFSRLTFDYKTVNPHFVVNKRF